MKQYDNEVKTPAQTQTEAVEIQQPEKVVYETPSLESHSKYNVLIGAGGSI
jgi:hypothetical protein